MESSTNLVNKKKKVSKKNKKSWIKYINNDDVEEFLDQQRLKERVGSFAEKKDEDLFVIDEGGLPQKNKLTKKEKARLPLKCFANLVNNCPIPDPVGKRTKVKTHEERKCRIRKSIEESQKKNGIVKKKILQAQHDRALTVRKKKKEPKELVFEKDIWSEDNKGIFVGRDTSWLTIDTIKHHKGTVRHSTPKDLLKRKSVVPPIETPHPGTSYNPTLKDHQDLLKKVADAEAEQLKEEAHIKRVTTDIFKKVTIHQKEARWIEEMSQGLNEDKNEEKNNETSATPLSINPPTTFQNKKTLKQRRKQKEQKLAALARKYAKVEKKKMADIYKLKFIQKEIESKEKKEEIAAQIREKQAELNVAKTKRLAALKYADPGLEFNRRCELRGNLRNIQKSGSLLSERFFSFQKRNILAPTAKVTRFRKAKVKRFTKQSHKIEGIDFISSIKKKGRK